MPAYKAGQEIDAFCTKCKMDLLHKIVAEVRGVPKQVECRTCKTTHMYRAVKGAHSPGAAPTIVASSGSSSGGSSTAAARRKPVVEEVHIAPPNGASIHPYNMTGRFAAEMWLMHKTFGTGLVLREVGPDKIEVRFESGTRVLIHGRTDA